MSYMFVFFKENAQTNMYDVNRSKFKKKKNSANEALLTEHVQYIFCLFQ